MIVSASNGSLILPTAITGTLTDFLTAAAAHMLKPAFTLAGGTIHGMLAYTPRETWMASAPAASRSFAIATASSISRPPCTFSSPLILKITGKSSPHFCFMFLMISVENLALLTKSPPNSSVLLFE